MLSVLIDENADSGKGDRMTTQRQGQLVTRHNNKEATVPRKAKTEDEELEDILEDLDDEEELEDDEELDEEEEDEEEEDEEDELEDELEDDEDEEDPDEAPRKSRSRTKKATKKAAPKRERTGVGTSELADAAGVDSRRLRMYLRAEGIEKTEGRYEWKSLRDPEARAIIQGIKKGKLKDIQKERLDNLKTKSNAKKTPAKASTRAKTAAKRTTARKK